MDFKLICLLISCQIVSITSITSKYGTKDVVTQTELLNANYGKVKIMNKIVVQTIIFPKPEVIPTPSFAMDIIDYIFVNETMNAKASIKILKGGVGFNNVTIEVKSALNVGLNFTVNIWGHETQCDCSTGEPIPIA